MQINILIYTDYDQINENDDLFSWGITELRKLIRHKTRRIGDFKVELQYRFASQDHPQKLTRDFLSKYQQLWVLCFNTARTSPYELDVDEVQELKEWMDKGGGLLVAGDHAAGFCKTGNPATFNTHGRSLGEPMKRAGQLRVWEGPPTACTDKPLKNRDNFNTCEGSDPEKLDSIESQSDEAALKLLPSRGTPHKLLWLGKDARGAPTFIERLPDHPHEGKLVIPRDLDGDWPPNSPFPVVAAKARDKRFPAENREYALVVAFDGDPAKVGRIVADSSFHHYININLSGLPERDSAGLPTPGSDLDQVAQFYGNLAMWLTPRDLRKQYKLDLFFQLATDPDVFEVRGSGIANLGQVAQYVLNLKRGGADLLPLIDSSEPEIAPQRMDELLVNILGIGSSSDMLTSEEQTTILGGIIEAHHNFFTARGAVTPAWLDTKPLPMNMIKEGIELASELQPSVEGKVLPLFQLAANEFEEDAGDS